MPYLILALLFSFLLSGCSTTYPVVTEYRINTKLNVEKVQSSKCKDKSIKVAQAFSSSLLMSLDMNYGVGDDKQFSYSQSQWALSPNNAMSAELVDMLRKMDIFQTVQIPKSRTRNDLILESSIDEFMQYYNEEENRSFVKVKISLSVIDTKTLQAIETKSFAKELEASSLDSSGGVKALNLALENLLMDSAKWIEEICR